MAHIENAKCRAIGKGQIEQVRAKKSEFKATLEAIQPGEKRIGLQGRVVKPKVVTDFTRYMGSVQTPGASAPPEFDSREPIALTWDYTGPLSHETNNDPWGQEKELLPSVPTATQPSDQQPAGLQEAPKTKESMDVFHPDHPYFNVADHLNKISHKFKCPHKGCP